MSTDKRKGEDLADIFAEAEREAIAAANTPEALADEERAQERRRARLKAEHEKGIRLGWWDEDGNPLGEPEDDDGDEGEDEPEDEGEA